MKITTAFLIALVMLTSPIATAGFKTGFESEFEIEPDKKAHIKNIILLIGDGMGPQQLGLLFSYARFAPDSIYKGQPTAIERFMEAGINGLSLTSPAEKIVTDSACSATQLATGFVSGSEMIGVNADGDPVETVLELAQRRGKATGLVSDTRLTHATPAAFAAHQPHRSLENEIAVEMLQQRVDVMLSGGLRHWIPAEVNDKGPLYQELKQRSGGHIRLTSKRKDSRNLLQEAQAAGYHVVFNREQLAPVNSPVLGLFSHSGMANGITDSQQQDNPERKEPTLKEMTLKALELLSADPDGFFLMVEGGQIDWAGHDNDVGRMLHEMIKFDEAVAAVYTWAAQRDDTIVLLTADHETGGFGFSYSSHQLPEGRTLPGKAFNDRLFKPRFNFIDRSILSQIYTQAKSYEAIGKEIDKLPKDQQNAEKVAEMLHRYTGFPVLATEAAYILGEPNKLDKHDKPRAQIHDFKEFYVYPKSLRSNLIGRVLAKYQGVTWGTGTHTATPVTVSAIGPVDQTRLINGINTHPEIGSLLKQWIGGD